MGKFVFSIVHLFVLEHCLFGGTKQRCNDMYMRLLVVYVQIREVQNTDL